MPDVLPEVVVPDVVPLVLPEVVPVVLPLVLVPDVLPLVEPVVVLPDVEPLVEPVVPAVVQALKMVSDEHSKAPVSTVSHLVFISWGKMRRNYSHRLFGYTGVRRAVYTYYPPKTTYLWPALAVASAATTGSSQSQSTSRTGLATW